MEHTLYTTPNKGSDINFGLDTQKEMDHKDTLKAFRTGSTARAVAPRMSLLDSLNEIHDTSQRLNKEKKTQEKLLGLHVTVSETDIKYIIWIQRKCEARMAQIDWLTEYQQEMKPDQSCVSIVTTGVIDALMNIRFY
ncbi:hypothetical protein ACF0H5_009138 [Mactra antiquata]